MQNGTKILAKLNFFMKNEKTNKVILIYSIIAILIYALSVFYFCYSLFTEFQLNSFITKEAFFACGRKSFLIILAVTFVTLLLIVFESQKNPEISPAPEEKACETEEKSCDHVESRSENAALQEEKNCEREKISNDSEKENDLSEKSLEEVSEENTASCQEKECSFEDLLSEGLHNAIADEQDYAVILVKILGIEKNSDDWKNVCKIIADGLYTNNGVFEHNENTIAILKAKTSLDENLILAENAISRVENTFGDIKPRCYAGISNRNVRIVTADRLIFEAEAALEHAQQTEEKVIAFRANSQAYNEFMNQQEVPLAQELEPEDPQ